MPGSVFRFFLKAVVTAALGAATFCLAGVCLAAGSVFRFFLKAVVTVALGAATFCLVVIPPALLGRKLEAA